MRYTSVVIGFLLGCFLVATGTLEGCTTDVKPTEKKVVHDAGVADKQVADSAPRDTKQPDSPAVTDESTPKESKEPVEKIADTPPKPPVRVNECKGSGACQALRDRSSLGGKSLPGMCHNGLCAPEASVDAKVKKGSVDLSCVTTPPTLPKGPDKATWFGPVETFGLKSNTVGVKVEIFDYAGDPDLKTPLATYTSELPKKTGDCPTKCAADRLCFYGQCVRDDDQETGYFVLKDLPTNKQLVIRTSGDNLVSTVQYNLWIPADKVKVVKVDGKDVQAYKERSFAITKLTQRLIPTVAGVPMPTAKEAVLAGEIQDCSGKQIEGAHISLSVLPTKTAYFNGNGSNPDPNQKWTNTDGIYVALNIPVTAPGDVVFRAVAKVGGKQVVVGSFKAKIFEGAASILTTRPWYPSVK